MRYVFYMIILFVLSPGFLMAEECIPCKVAKVMELRGDSQVSETNEEQALRKEILFSVSDQTSFKSLDFKAMLKDIHHAQIGRNLPKNLQDFKVNKDQFKGLGKRDTFIRALDVNLKRTVVPFDKQSLDFKKRVGNYKAEFIKGLRDIPNRAIKTAPIVVQEVAEPGHVTVRPERRKLPKPRPHIKHPRPVIRHFDPRSGINNGGKVGFPKTAPVPDIGSDLPKDNNGGSPKNNPDYNSGPHDIRNNVNINTL